MGAEVTFDPTVREIQGTTAPDAFGNVVIDVQVDIFSDGKEDWQSTPSLSQNRFPLDGIGGQQFGNRILGTSYLLSGGWQYAPFEADHTLLFIGNFDVDTSVNPNLRLVLPTTGGFTVSVEREVTSFVLVENTQGADLALVRKAHTNRQFLRNVGTDIAPVWKWTTWDDDDATIITDLDHFVEDPSGAQPTVSDGSIGRRSKGGIILP